MFEAIKGFFMNILNIFKSYSIKEVTGIDTHISSFMYERIRLWADMAAGQAPWNEEAPPCGVLDQIAGRLSMMVLREIAIEVRNDAIKPVMEHLDANIDKVVEYITLLGSALVRPIYSEGRLQYEALPLGNYLPTSYDFDGTLTGALIFKQVIDGKKLYLLVEQHTYKNNAHSVECTLYRNDLGTMRKVNLTDCQQTADITPAYTWQHVKQPMIIEFRNHSANKIDGSNVPVAIIAGAENLIQDADEQYERMNWEQEGGELRVFADRDMFEKRVIRDGGTVGVKMTKSLNRLVTMIDGDGSPDGKKITEHAPNLRTASQNEMFQQILRRIELTCNIGKGTISDMESVQQTATQYSGGRQELYAIIDRIEDEIEVKYQQCADVFAYMAAAYGLGSNDSHITITWNDDATRKDIMQAKQQEIQEINAGIRDKWEYRRDFFGEDELTARANVPIEPVQSSPFDLA